MLLVRNEELVAELPLLVFQTEHAERLGGKHLVGNELPLALLLGNAVE